VFDMKAITFPAPLFRQISSTERVSLLNYRFRRAASDFLSCVLAQKESAVQVELDGQPAHAETLRKHQGFN
jgi:hypothetical protein